MLCSTLVPTVLFILVTQLKGNTNFIHKKGPRNEQERLKRIGLQVPLAMCTFSLSILYIVPSQVKLFLFESACHIAQADLELATSLKLTLNS